MYYPRSLRSRLQEVSNFFPAIVVSGARQSGKTTLLREAFAHHDYVSLDLPSAAEQAERNPEAFLERHLG